MNPLPIKPSRALLVLTSAIFILQFSNVATAQEAVTPPVARLITSSAHVSNRPRRSHDSASEAKVETEALSFANAKAIERRAFELTNDARVRNGLPALVWDGELCRMAREHSAKMAREKFFSHQTPEGQRLKDRARAIGVGRFRVIAENIAFNQGFEDPGAFAVSRWLTSPGHRANILYPEFNGSAIGVFVSDDGAVYLTQAFIAR